MKADNGSSDGRELADAWQRWLNGRRFGLLLGVLIVASFPGVILGWQTFVFRDYGLFGYPVAHYFREQFWLGKLPLWNPLNDCGTPFMAQWVTLVLYPLSLIYLLLPLTWGLGLFCLAHLWWAGMGMYRLARDWTGDSFAGGMAGVAFAFNGLMLNCLMWPNYMAVCGWMPWVVWAGDRARRQGGSWVGVAALVGAMQMLGGAPEPILLTWIIIGGMWVAHAFGSGRGGWGALKRLAAVVLLTSGLAAAQLLPFFDFLSHSDRDVQYGDSTWAMPGTGWANFLVPLFRCHRSNAGVYFQNDQAFTSSYYAGIGVLALALLAVIGVRERRVYVLGLLSAMAMVLAMGEWHSRMQHLFPPLGFMRFPVKWVLLPIFALPLLAAYASPSRYFNARVFLRRSAIMFLVLGIGSVAIIWFSYHWLERREEWPATVHSGLTRLGFLAAILFTLAQYRRWQGRQTGALTGLVVMVLVWLDVLTHAPAQNPVVAPDVYIARLPARNALNPEPALGHSRFMIRWGTHEKLQRTMLADPVDSYLCLRLGQHGMCNLLDNLPKMDSSLSLHLNCFRQAVTRFAFDPNPSPLPLADYLGISQVSSLENDLAWSGRSSWMPLLTAGQKPIFTDPTNTLKAMLSMQFRPRQEIYLTFEAARLVRATNQSAAQITACHVEAQRIEAEVEAPEASMVSVAQNYYHPWRAYVDGQPTRIFPANYAFQALEVPPGRHRIELIYQDGAFIIGCVVSIFTLGFLTIWGCRNYRRKRINNSWQITGTESKL